MASGAGFRCVSTPMFPSMAEGRAGSEMAVREIVKIGAPVLRQKAKKVSRFDQSIQQLIDDMIETMKDVPGVGLAAPQVAVPLRIIVVDVEDQVTVLVNPEIQEMDGEYEPEEGCLSIPGYVANVCLLYTSPSPRDGLLSR